MDKKHENTAVSRSGGADGGGTAGTVTEWNQHIAPLCIGVSRLVLAVCVALAGPLLKILGREGGGFHFVGPSSCGKTTLLRVAASVIGAPSTIKSLDSTANALESLAVLANDTLLLLDELGLSAAETVGQIVYKLTAGMSRGRADQRGDARARRVWRILFMTTGEIDLETMMRGANKRPAAGQQLRLANIPACPEGGKGIFEELHGFPDGAALADHLRAATAKYHGAPFRAFLECLVRDFNNDPDGLRERLGTTVKAFVGNVAPAGSDGQVVRVAARFGLLAAAGEYAARCGVLAWPEGDAEWGVRECFNSWLQRRGGTGAAEVGSLIDGFTSWLHANGEARFTPMESGYKGPARPVVNRAGFRCLISAVSGDSYAEYYIFPHAFREAVAGHEPRWAARILGERGLLATNEKGEFCIQKRLPGEGNTRVYHVPAQTEKSP